MDLGLFDGDPAVAHEVGDDAVVLGDLGERLVAEQVAAAVADVGDVQARAFVAVIVLVQQRERDDRGAHALEVGIGVALVADAVVGDGDGFLERLRRVVLVGDLERLDGQS